MTDATPEPTSRRRDASGEAAARRTELRDTRAERDGFSARLTAARRREVERVVGASETLTGTGGDVASLMSAADLWEILGASPDDFRDEDGELDTTALADYIGERTADREYLRRPPYHPDPIDFASRLTRPAAAPPSDPGTAWRAALNPETSHR